MQELDHNSLLYWYPIVKDYFETPETIVYKPKKDMMHWLGNGISPYQIKKIKALLKDDGIYFLRTDMASNKHNWKEACIVGRKYNIGPKIMDTLDFNYRFDLEPTALIFREMLEANIAFRAFNDFPVAYEIRAFVSGGKLDCMHNYWAKEVFVKDKWAQRTIPKDWESKWDALYRRNIANVQALYEMLIDRLPNIRLQGSWSMDFMYANRADEPLKKQWFLIDMADARMSYHFDHKSDLLIEGKK